MTKIPANTDEALEAILDCIMTKWPQGDRAKEDAALRRQRKWTYGLALNTLAHFDVNDIDPTLVSAAEAALTSSDRAELQKGG